MVYPEDTKCTGNYKIPLNTRKAMLFFKTQILLLFKTGKSETQWYYVIRGTCSVLWSSF